MPSVQHVDAFLVAYPEQVRKIASAARDFMKGVLPDISEAVDEYGPGYKGVICTLIMSQAGVKLGIFRGSELPDPKHLMRGTGKVHRHVLLRSVDDLRQPGLRQLIKDALAAWRRRNTVAKK